MVKSRRHQLNTLKKALAGAKYEPTILHDHNDLVTGETFTESQGWVFYLLLSGLMALWTMKSIANTVKAKNSSLDGTPQGTFPSHLNCRRPASLY
jgi:hypothetical protein